jgi:hypothetical protein
MLFGVPTIAGLLVGAWVIRPLIAGPVGFDSAASVIHFERIVHGQHLEAFVTATPKPLLTVLYGVLHAAIPDWRAISWLSIAGLAVAIGLASVLADRVSGAMAAGFAAAGVLGSATLLLDVSRSYAVVWALLGWLVAGLALSGVRPRYAIAGFALLLASLARLETLVLVPITLAVLVGDRVIPGPDRERLPRAAWWLLLPIAAIPILMLHDQLLTGDPWFWASVAQRFSVVQADAVKTPGELARTILSRYGHEAAISLLAILGFAVLLRERRWAIAAGSLGLSVGVVGFLLVLAYRGTYVSTRYLAPIDLALVFAAAVGFGRLRVPSLRWREGRARVPAAAGVAFLATGGAVVAVLLSVPFAPLDKATRSVIKNERLVAEHADAALPALGRALAEIPDSRSPRGQIDSTPERASLLVPSPLRPRLSLDLDVPLTNVAGNVPELARPDGPLHAGQVLLHDRLADTPDDAYAAFEIEAPARLGGVALDPVLSNPADGWWVVAVR